MSVPPEFLRQLAEIVGPENLFDDRIECLCNSRDMSVHQGVPDAVVFARSTEQVVAVMKLASRDKVPVVARGTGSSVTGAVLPVKGGLLLDLHLMNRILEINRQDFYARLEPGVLCLQLNTILARDKLMFPPNPGSEAIATIGGMVSTNASGHRAVKYGTTRDYIKGLKVVLADGTVVDTGTTAPKTSLGYDLTRLFSSAEGTLGIITEVTVKLEPKPEYGGLAIAVFGDLNSAGDAVTEVTTSGIKLAGCEIMDKFSLKVVEEALGRDVSRIEALLIMEADGVKDVVVRDMERIEQICRKHQVQDFEWTDDPARREEMMLARGRLVPTLSRIKPGNRLIPIAEDFGVPSTRIPETIRRAQEISRKHNVLITTFGHVGDGNVHTTFVADVRDREEWKRLKAAAEELVTTAMEMKGTLSAEHGTGLTRAPHIESQLGTGMQLMRRIKQALDPDNILNPGKMNLEEGGRPADIFDHFAFQPLLEHPEGVRSYGRKVDDEVLACIHCGFCRLGCPTFSVTQRESRNARGRNALAFQYLNGTLEPSEELAQAFYTCTTCQACTYFCPARIKVDEIVEGVRRKLYQSGFAPAPVKAVRDNIVQTGNVFASAKADRIEIYPPEFKEKIGRQGLKPRAETLLFMGCVPSYLDMKMVPSLLKPLAAAGVDFTTLGTEEGCCGFPLFLMGTEEFEAHSAEVLERIRATGARELVTPCSGCYKTFRKLYPGLAELGVEVYHSVHYLEKLVREGRIRLERKPGQAGHLPRSLRPGPGLPDLRGTAQPAQADSGPRVGGDGAQPAPGALLRRRRRGAGQHARNRRGDGGREGAGCPGRGRRDHRFGLRGLQGQPAQGVQGHPEGRTRQDQGHGHHRDRGPGDGIRQAWGVRRQASGGCKRQGERKVKCEIDGIRGSASGFEVSKRQRPDFGIGGLREAAERIMMEDRKPERKELAATAALKKLMADHFQELDEAARDRFPENRLVHQRGAGRAAAGMGFLVYFPENHGAMLGATRMAADLIPYANAVGYSPDICSYLTSDVGSFLQKKTPLTSAYEIESVPRPDVLVFNTNQCRDVQDWFSWYARELKVPLLGVHTHREHRARSGPTTCRTLPVRSRSWCRAWKRSAAERLDMDRFKEAVADSRRTSELWRACLESAAAVPSPWTFFDATIHMGPAVVARGTPEAVDYYELLLAELKERIDGGVAAVEGERHRLYWEGMPIWGKLQVALGAVLSAAAPASWPPPTATAGSSTSSTPSGPSKAWRGPTPSFSSSGTRPTRSATSRDCHALYQFDGIIFHDAKTCPNNSNNRYGMPERLEPATWASRCSPSTGTSTT